MHTMTVAITETGYRACLGCGMTEIQGAEWTGCEMSTCYKDDRTIDLDISKQGRRIREQGKVVVAGAKCC